MGTILPNQLYQVFKSRPLTEEGKNALIHLYQPIIGSDAFALYSSFESDIKTASEPAFDSIHMDILSALDFGMSRFIEARKKLEGIGLLKVFSKDDSELGTVYLYELQEPVHPERFFQDELYSFLLLSKVGDRKFQQLVGLFQPKKAETSGYQEVTLNFMEVYGLNTRDFSAKEDQLGEIQVGFKEEKAEIKLEKNQLDWPFLLHEAERRYISAKNFTNQFRKKLTLYHNLYGYDVLELLDMLGDTVSLADGMIDQKALEKLVLKSAQQQFSKKEQRSADYTSDAEIRRFNTLKQDGFSDNDLRLIKESESHAPLEFLRAIKTEKNSFVTDSEHWLLKSLVERSPLSNSVINVLTHYVLVVQNNASLAPNFVNTIAAQWSELKIQNAEEAIRHVRELVKNAKQKRSTPAKNKKIIREEKLPDWVDAPVEEPTLSPQRQAEINQKLQQYLQKKAGDN